MVELKEKTVEELRKMASRKKIEGRSKMNKSELVKALKKKTSTKKTIKRRKMRGGALTIDEIRDVLSHPQNYLFKFDQYQPIRILSIREDGPNLMISRPGAFETVIPEKPFHKSKLSILESTGAGAGGVRILYFNPAAPLASAPVVTAPVVTAPTELPQNYVPPLEAELLRENRRLLDLDVTPLNRFGDVVGIFNSNDTKLRDIIKECGRTNCNPKTPDYTSNWSMSQEQKECKKLKAEYYRCLKILTWLDTCLKCERGECNLKEITDILKQTRILDHNRAYRSFEIIFQKMVINLLPGVIRRNPVSFKELNSCFNDVYAGRPEYILTKILPQVRGERSANNTTSFTNIGLAFVEVYGPRLESLYQSIVPVRYPSYNNEEVNSAISFINMFYTIYLNDFTRETDRFSYISHEILMKINSNYRREHEASVARRAANPFDF
jgi:hypothetical protein